MILFAVLLRCKDSNSFVITLMAAVCAFAGRSRLTALTICTMSYLAIYADRFPWPQPTSMAQAEGAVSGRAELMAIGGIVLLGVYACSALIIRHVRRFPAGFIARRPTEWLLIAFFAAAGAASLPGMHGRASVVAWTIVSAIAWYMWFLGYAILDQRTRQPPSTFEELGIFHFFWGSTASTPWGKGLTYLQRVEAKTALDLAVTQIKGIKLMIWCLLLAAAALVADDLVHNLLGIPEFRIIFERHRAGTPFPVLLCWISLISSYFESILNFAAFGHSIVAAARMAGFRLLRNTCRPLSSVSIAEFWNRYYYFYKELLVEFFFYPAFLRYFKRYPKLRLAFATVMAAGVGNLLYHFITQISVVTEIGWRQSVIGFQTFAFYAAMLSIGIVISQLRPRKKHNGWWRGRLIPAVAVAAFFCLLHIFNDFDRHATLAEHLRLTRYLISFGAW